MFNEMTTAFKRQDANLVKGLTRRMHDIERLSLVTHRLLRSLILFPRSAEQTDVTMIDCVDYLQVLHIITTIANNVNKISEIVMTLSEHTLPKSILDSLYQTCIHIQEFYDQCIRALLSKNMQVANELLDSKLTLENL